MKTPAAVLYEMGVRRPYAESGPLVIEDVTLDGPATDEVLLEIVAAGLCHSDLSVINGSRPRVMPMVLGHEASGIVRELGPGVQGLKVGDHVVCSYVPMCGACLMCRSGAPSLCEPGGRANARGTLLTDVRRFRNPSGRQLNHHLGVSGFSRYTVVSPRSLVVVDPAMPLDKAALFGCAVATGVGAVVNTARVEPGSAVAVFGMGGVGLSAVMGARAAGAHPVVAVDVLPAKLRLAEEAGATHTIDATESDPIEAVREVTDGGARYAFECVGSVDVFAQAYAATRVRGSTVCVGLDHPSRNLTIPCVSMVAEERIVRGAYMGSSVPARDIPRFMRMYNAGTLPVDLLHTHDIELDGINEAFDRLADGAAVRQVLRFDRD
ncbi:zinc-binding dehydrogenase [Candidatus Poribacteria bacterium]|jgi:alcohol dehydrogenase|nr:zinc-binding dehydrogenase [Candidatus Poribacteria bacterium]MBT7096540.1 zinc-binding dehydrogenase [Candidatus Poribacteria bacterium]MBT7803933.1 zinc-binding dehydrogenase [Candidatus Poribacteria bacterium]